MPLQKKLFKYKKSKTNEYFALHIALHCMRNTVIEKYHLEGKISDLEMKAFNKEVANKIYSFLELIANPDLKQEHDVAFQGVQGLTPLFYSPEGWDMPEFDERFKKIIEKHWGWEQAGIISKQ